MRADVVPDAGDELLEQLTTCAEGWIIALLPATRWPDVRDAVTVVLATLAPWLQRLQEQVDQVVADEANLRDQTIG